MPSLLSQVSLSTVPDQASVQCRVPSQSSSLDDNSGHIEFLKNVFYQGLPVSTHPYYQDVLHRSAQIIYHEIECWSSKEMAADSIQGSANPVSSSSG